MSLKNPNLIKYLKSHNLQLEDSEVLTGGTIAQSYCLTISNKKYFYKTYGNDNSQHHSEAESLEFLRKGNFFKTPEVIFCCDDFILMEYIEHGELTSKFYENFGLSLAKFHKQDSDIIGLKNDNFIGRTKQMNSLIRFSKEQVKRQWIDFFWTYRLEYQLSLFSYPKQINDAMRELREKLGDFFLDWEEHICPLHGDLWGKNHFSNKQGQVVLVDPANYHGCREVELALMSLFKSFPDEFWASYKKEFPLKNGFQSRKKLYQLYHLFNHQLLFGGSYLSQIQSTLFSLLQKPGYSS